MNARLQAKIEARNKLNAAIVAQVPLYLAALAPFIGKKVKLANGELSAKLKSAIPSTTINGVQMFLTSQSRYTLYMTFKTSVQTPNGHAYYASADVALAGVASDFQTLEKVVEFRPDYYRTNYTEREILEHRSELEHHQSKAREHESALAHFGTHDNN